MTKKWGSVVAERTFTETLNDDWVLTLSLKEPGRVAESVPWVRRGSLRGFFHGLLFDRETLLRSPNRDQLNPSDAELLLRAYEFEGEAVFSRLRGSFVAVIVDDRRHLVFVIRDPVGSHPLFYAEVNSEVLFSTSSQALLEHRGVSRALNRAVLADHLCGRWPHRHETFFAAIRRVPPGWRACISAGHVTVERYWDPMPEGKPVQWLTAEETLQFDEVFDRAVDRCLHSGPTGIFLSGGLDSITVAAVAADRARRIGVPSPHALSIGFPDPECDERALQRAVARDLRIQQHLLDFKEALGSRPLFAQALLLTQGLSAPLLNPWFPAYLNLAKLAKLRGVETILTGHGGDEWLCVSPLHAADLIRRGALIDLIQFIRATQRSYNLRSFSVARNLLWNSGLRPLGGLVLHRIMPDVHKTSRAKRLLSGDPAWVSPDRQVRVEQQRRAEAAMPHSDPPRGFYMREGHDSVDHSMMSWDSEERYEVGNRMGIRFLHPFTDPDVVEVLSRIPPHVLNEGGKTKGLVRGTLARRFPSLGFERQRKVLAKSFYESLLRNEGSALAAEAGEFPALSALGVIDGRAAAAFMRDELKQPSRRFQKIWDCVNLEMWVRSHSG